MLLLAVACASAGAGPRDVAFQIVAEGQFGRMRDASIAVAIDDPERARLGTLAGRPLAGEVLIAIFMGERSTGGHAVRVESVTVEGNDVRVHGAFAGPPPGGIVTQVITSPFAIVALRRGDLPSGRTTFVFSDGTKTLVRADATLP